MASVQDPFSEFRLAVSRHFAPVAVAFGLGAGEERELFPDFYITFSGLVARLVVGVEAESTPWVYVVLVNGDREDRFGLHTLVEDAEGTFVSVTQVEALPATDDQVRVLAELTRRHAAAILRGDASRVPILRALRAKAHRERNRRLMGTPSGVFTRDHRPTLAELFAEAHGAEFPVDVRLACVHAAGWADEYSIEDVARFLHIDEADAQRIVDVLDTLTDEPLEELRAIVGTGK